MSNQVLLDLQAAHAFDAAPLRHDLGIYHVPFGELTDVDSPEDRLRGVADRGERTVVVGRPGSGKSSLIEHVLGPTAERVAPILVPVSGEPSDLAGNVQGVAGLIIQTIVDHSHLPERDRTSALKSAASTRSIQPSTRTNRLTVGSLDGSRAQSGYRPASPADPGAATHSTGQPRSRRPAPHTHPGRRPDASPCVR